MKWLVTCREEHQFFKDLVQYLREQDEIVNPLFSNATVDHTILDYDILILKSKMPIFLCAGFLAKFHGKKVVPDPLVAHRLRNRWEAEIWLRRMGIKVPPAMVAHRDILEKECEEAFFPAIAKPIMGSMSQGVNIIQERSNLKDLVGKGPFYLQKKVEGIHYEVDFILDTIYMMEKDAMVHQTRGAPLDTIPEKVKDIVRTYRKETGLMIGDMDVVLGDEVWVVDPGTFPSFSGIEEAGTLAGEALLRFSRSNL